MHEIFYNIFSSFGRLDFCSIFLIFVAFIELAKQWHTINMIFMKLCFHEFFFRSFGGLDFWCSNRIQILVLKHHERSFSRILFFLASFYPQPLLASKALWKICSDLVQNF